MNSTNKKKLVGPHDFLSQQSIFFFRNVGHLNIIYLKVLRHIKSFFTNEGNLTNYMKVLRHIKSLNIPIMSLKDNDR